MYFKTVQRKLIFAFFSIGKIKTYLLSKIQVIYKQKAYDGNTFTAKQLWKTKWFYKST